MYSQLVHRAGLREVITAIIILLSLDLPPPLLKTGGIPSQKEQREI